MPLDGIIEITLYLSPILDQTVLQFHTLIVEFINLKIQDPFSKKVNIFRQFSPRYLHISFTITKCVYFLQYYSCQDMTLVKVFGGYGD